MEGEAADARAAVSILDVLRVDLCARAILGHVSVEDLARSERVCKRWQLAVHYYLQGCRDLGFKFFNINNSFYYPVLRTNHRTIIINYDNYSLPIVGRILEKWGPSLRIVITDLSEDVYLHIIAEKCPNLQQIEIILSENNDRYLPSLYPVKNFKKLKQIALIEWGRFSLNNHSDAALAELFQDIDCKSITINFNENITGNFLKYLRPNNLESLNVWQCSSVRISELLSAVHNLRKVTSLELQSGSSMHLLLKEMPQLEDLRLHYSDLSPFSEEAITVFSSLVNLKRLSMYGTHGRVRDRFLETLGRGCSKLEYLEIRGSAMSITSRGVAALCRRALTTLHFGVSDEISDAEIVSYFTKHIKTAPLYEELATLGFVEMTQRWFVAACRDPRGRTLDMGPTAQPVDPNRELKLILF